MPISSRGQFICIVILPLRHSRGSAKIRVGLLRAAALMSDPTEIPDRPPSPNTQNTIRIRGARQHNLKNIDLELPRDRLIVFTGVFGSV